MHSVLVCSALKRQVKPQPDHGSLAFDDRYEKNSSGLGLGYRTLDATKTVRDGVLGWVARLSGCRLCNITLHPAAHTAAKGPAKPRLTLLAKTIMYTAQNVCMDLQF